MPNSPDKISQVGETRHQPATEAAALTADKLAIQTEKLVVGSFGFSGCFGAFSLAFHPHGMKLRHGRI
jgi:hypothetical protein